ncbi:hypothetical protein [Streptomyces capitiformicae]|uniref:Uncharacterized protein n=1 Tax=Streptomyces capitiformicae TaxID=2014920 RepID=A0A919L4L4_9ACTN|nr:hypothetical protein [Streptomyces capitiformicae]GHH83274.1 hypothetical protein GCM10017771_09680 [Streptomyces capitiformicae]
MGSPTPTSASTADEARRAELRLRTVGVVFPGAQRTLLGLVIAMLPSVVLASRISGFVLSVRWWQLGVLAAATYAAAFLAAVLSAHKLRVTEARAT